MYKPIVCSQADVMNKVIVYSDIILDLKDLGDNIKVTSISNVSEHELQRCLEQIFKANPNVVFKIVQYSKKDKKVYFYTEGEIEKKQYLESNFFSCKLNSLKKQILEEIKVIMLASQNKDKACVSLYDVSAILRKINFEYEKMQKTYKDKFEDIIGWNLCGDSRIIVYGFDYDNQFLKIGFRRFSFEDYEEIWFARENEDLYIVKSKSNYSQRILKVLGSQLSALYDEFLGYSDYKDYGNSKLHIKAVNSNFEIDISHYGVSVCIRNLKNRYINDFELTAHSYENHYELDCNSNLINEVIIGKENEIFRRIFIKISDCPEWLQDELYDFRRKQLDEEKRLEEEIKYKETKKQKRLELVRKFNLFRKKEK